MASARRVWLLLLSTLGPVGLVVAGQSGVGGDSVAQADTAAREEIQAVQWTGFPNEGLTVHGLPWFSENAPRLWRLPERASGELPDAVRRLMRCPAGARLRFVSDTSQLRIRVDTTAIRSMGNMSPIGCGGIDLYVDGAYWCSGRPSEVGTQEIVLFRGISRQQREITLYLPTFQELDVLAVGIDEDARLGPAPALADKRPIVYYGSSIAQGGCSSRPAMSYEAILSRRLDLDFVNLGFSGAGKAEAPVVRLVGEIDACCFVLDLGKSFGKQPVDVYANMLGALRAEHPRVPIVCITPIFSTRESYDPAYLALSEHVRDVIRQAVAERIREGDDRLHLVEGMDLLGPADADAYQEGVHPTDLGFTRIADRLEPVLTDALSTADTE